jgi:transposase
MCELLVGLPDVKVLAVEDTIPLRVHIEVADPSRSCPDCGSVGVVKERRRVELVDLPSFGRPVRLVWHKHRLTCPSLGVWPPVVDQPGRSDRGATIGHD